MRNQWCNPDQCQQGNKLKTWVSTNLESDQEEETINQDAPDGNVGEDSSNKTFGTNHDCTVPVNGNECPCKRT
jgi:hypothetical protein